jgi:hypothetical protein
MTVHYEFPKLISFFFVSLQRIEDVGSSFPLFRVSTCCQHKFGIRGWIRTTRPPLYIGAALFWRTRTNLEGAPGLHWDGLLAPYASVLLFVRLGPRNWLPRLASANTLRHKSTGTLVLSYEGESKEIGRASRIFTSIFPS